VAQEGTVAGNYYHLSLMIVLFQVGAGDNVTIRKDLTSFLKAFNKVG
jgi:hypothetical protein